MSEAWIEVREMKTSFIKKMDKTLSGYSYADKPHAFSTNQKLGEYLIKSLRKSKSRLFDIVQFLYEVQSEKISSHFEKYRNELDHLSDRIKVRHFEWHGLPEKFLQKILDLDRELMRCEKAIAQAVEEIYRLSVGFKRADHKEFDVKGIERASGKLEKIIRSMTMAFEKRSALIEIKKSDLELDYRRIEREIEQKF